MHDLSFAFFWFFMGIAATVATVAWCIKQDDNTTFRKTLGDILKDFGEAIAKDATKPPKS